MNEAETDKLPAQLGVPKNLLFDFFLFDIHQRASCASSEKKEVVCLLTLRRLINQENELILCLVKDLIGSGIGLHRTNGQLTPKKYDAICFGSGRPDKNKIGASEVNHITSCR